MNKEEALGLISDEYDRAVGKFGAFHNAHEGWGVIREEYLELEDEIRKKQENYDLDQMRKEAMQLGAMALRFMVDVCGSSENEESHKRKMETDKRH